MKRASRFGEFFQHPECTAYFGKRKVLVFLCQESPLRRMMRGQLGYFPFKKCSFVHSYAELIITGIYWYKRIFITGKVRYL